MGAHKITRRAGGKYYVNGISLDSVNLPLRAAMMKLCRYEEMLPDMDWAEDMHELFIRGYTPERIRELERMYSEKCREVNELLGTDGWIPCMKRLPVVREDAGEWNMPEYITTTETAVKSCVLKYAGDGIWVDSYGETHDVVAWKPFPQAYKTKEPGT